MHLNQSTNVTYSLHLGIPISLFSQLIELTSVDWGKHKLNLKNKFSIYFIINICMVVFWFFFPHFSD